MYDLNQLRTFVTVVQEGHVTRASERLNISQPTASHHIRALEEEFGLRLFHRTSRGLEPTAAGLRLAEWAGRVIQCSHELANVAREMLGSPTGRLSIGTIADSRLLSMLPRVVQALRKQYPLVELNIEPGNSLSIKQAIKAGDLDAGFAVGVLDDEELIGHTLDTLEYLLAGPYSWRKRLASASLTELAAMPWILTARASPGREIAERVFRPLGLQMNVVAETGNEMLLRSLVKGEVGIGVVARFTAEQEAAAQAMCLVPRLAGTGLLQFTYAPSRAADPVLRFFVETLKSEWASNGGTASN